MDSALRPPSKTGQLESTAFPPGAFIGTLAALVVAFWVFSYSSTTLLGFPDRPIGLGPLNGIDPSRRFGIYVRMVAGGVGAWLACHHAARWLRRRWPSWFVGVRSRLENSLINSFCAIASLALVARVIVDKLDGLACFYHSLGAVALVAALALARRLAPRASGWRRQLSAYELLGALALSAWPSLHVVGVAAGLDPAAKIRIQLGALVLPVVFGAGIGWWLRKTKPASRGRVRRACVVALVPFFAFPTLCPMANELEYTIARRHVVDPRQLALAALALLVLASVVLLGLTFTGRLRISAQRWLARLALPLIVFGSALITHHQQALSRGELDSLHDGEQITAVYELLAHGRWPFIDVWPAHGLYDYVGTLYAKANGFLPLELGAWNPALVALTLTAVYALLASLYRPLFALAVVVALPVQSLFPLPQYSFFYAEPGLLALALLMGWTLARARPRRALVLALASSCYFFWTPASGVACIIAATALLILAFITERTGEARRRLTIFAGTGLSVALAYLLVITVSGRPVLDTLKLAAVYIRADPMIGGRESVLSNLYTLAIWQYLVLPSIGVLYVVQLCRHALDRRRLSRAEQILAFLALTSLVLFARTLARHTLFERYQAFFFPFLGLALPFLRRAESPLPGTPESSGAGLPSTALRAYFARAAGSRSWFCAGMALYLVAFPADWTDLLRVMPFKFRTWQRDEHRTEAALPAYPALRRFLDENLRSDQTFLELLNMPLLYAALQREVPGQFFLPTMFYATDTAQDSLLKRFDAFGGPARVPIVFMPGPHGMGDIDDIATAFRSYRVSERIHRDYVPFTSIDGFDVWVSQAVWNAAAAQAPPLALSWQDASAYHAKALSARREGDVLVLEGVGANAQLTDALKLEGVSASGLGGYRTVEFSYRANAEGSVAMSFRYGRRPHAEQDSGSMALHATSEWQAGSISIPVRAEPAQLANIGIEPTPGMTLELRDLKLVHGDPQLPPPESFAAGMLPFFWGNFPGPLAAQGGQVEQALTVPGDATAKASFDFALQPGYDKSSGNALRLCVRLSSPAPGQRAPRWKSVVHAAGWEVAGNMTVRYGEPPSSFRFHLVQPNAEGPGVPVELLRSFAHECKAYVVRLSTAYVWQRQDVAQIHVETSVPVTIESAELLRGD